MRLDNTICAIATGRGGAIGVIRVSGADSLSICDKIFKPADKRLKFLESKGYSLIYGEIIDNEEILDNVIVSVFRSPLSYTGEDSVEISCHASPYIQQRIIELLIENGASAAMPGEFTQRAFLNGKLDLSQAEAVADLIASESYLAHKVAMNQMKGGFSNEIANIRKQLLHFASMLELELDFGEEDVEFADRKELIIFIEDLLSASKKLTSSFRVGNVIKNGVPVAIIGNPNTGKSTLLNRLVNEEMAIVSDIPGTTRDSIEDVVNLEGIQFRFIDTAGIRKTDDVIENLGINKTIEKIGKAVIIILVADIADGVDNIFNILGEIRERIKDSDKELILALNKVDKANDGDISNIKKLLSVGPGESMIFISAKNGEGVDKLEESLVTSASRFIGSTDNVIVTNARHYEALINVNDSLKRVLQGLSDGLPEDLIAIDLRQAIHYYGTITGEISSDEVLGNIFKNFCIGK
ncbi:MAG TPA: tRNA uridine-5-carboxymethylaminomethyl(34) synthesis GTPase MnmE [Bacteroidetes bacterium]|nr:tRNA uridine-5-carboxymethylaminomethyl(34) synthesis GTPase MnmE [Bacteroidota bacterium]